MILPIAHEKEACSFPSNISLCARYQAKDPPEAGVLLPSPMLMLQADVATVPRAQYVWRDQTFERVTSGGIDKKKQTGSNSVNLFVLVDLTNCLPTSPLDERGS